jgi:hypothetical protein
MKLEILFASVVCSGVLLPAEAKAQKPPNIVFIFADNLGFGDVGCYNLESKVPTPHLDQLAKQGMPFTDAHSPSTVCTPSRYSLLTGRMAFRNGMRGVFSGVRGPCLIEENRLTLPQMLKDKGFDTAMFGKWHVGMTFFARDGRPVYEAKLVNRKDAPGQLYNLDSDPGETTNLYFEHPEIVKELKAKLEDFKSSGRSVPAR